MNTHCSGVIKCSSPLCYRSQMMTTDTSHLLLIVKLYFLCNRVLTEAPFDILFLGRGAGGRADLRSVTISYHK